MMGETFIDEGRLHLRIEPRNHGGPWVVETTSLARALAAAGRPLDPNRPLETSDQ
jgi:hypothetical protein